MVLSNVIVVAMLALAVALVGVILFLKVDWTLSSNPFLRNHGEFRLSPRHFTQLKKNPLEHM